MSLPVRQSRELMDFRIVQKSRESAKQHVSLETPQDTHGRRRSRPARLSFTRVRLSTATASHAQLAQRRPPVAASPSKHTKNP